MKTWALAKSGTGMQERTGTWDMGRAATRVRGRGHVISGKLGRGIGEAGKWDRRRGGVKTETPVRGNGKADTVGNLAMFPLFVCKIVVSADYVFLVSFE